MEETIKEACGLAGEACEAAEGEPGIESGAEGNFFESVKTSLPGLDVFDPSVFDIRMVIGALALVGLAAYIVYRVFVKKVVGEDDFFTDLGISYKDFDMPDEVDDYYETKEETNDSAKLRNALLKRAIADIPIILRMQNEGPGIYNMYQQAMIGEKEWQSFQEAEAMISEEIESVQEEADEIEKGWSQSIWPLAMQLRTVLVKRREEMEMKAADENGLNDKDGGGNEEEEEGEEESEEDEEEDENDPSGSKVVQ